MNASDETYPNKVAITWDAATGATYYEVWRHTSDDRANATRLVTNVTGTSYDDTSTFSGMTYHYWVISCNAEACRDLNQTSDDTGKPQQHVAISRPFDISASDGAYADKVRVTWTNSGGTAYNEIWRNTTDNWQTAEKLVTNQIQTTYDDTNVSLNVIYYYWVTACTDYECHSIHPDADDSGFSSSISNPANVNASDGNYANKVALTWDAATDATYYEVWRHTSDDRDNATKLVTNVTGTSYDDTSAVAETTYYYWVIACNVEGCKALYQTADDTGFSSAISNPENVNASDETYPNKVAITWDAATGATYYEVWRHTSDDRDNATQLVTNVTGTSYDDTSTFSGMTYHYWVISCNAEACRDLNQTSDDTGKPQQHVAISRPFDISASDGAYADKVRVTWTNSGGTAYNEIWRNTTDNWQTAEKLVTNQIQTTYDDTNVSLNVIYYYWVTACTDYECHQIGHDADDSGYSTNSLANNPANVNASDGTYADKVEVSWAAVTGASHYEVWRNTTNNTGSATRLAANQNASPYDDTTAVTNQTYHYWVTACNWVGCNTVATANSDTGSLQTQSIDLSRPTNTSATDGTYSDKVQVSWDEPYQPDSGMRYEIWRNSSASEVGATCLVTDDTATPYDDSTGSIGVTYHYAVKVCDGDANCSPFSNWDDGYRSDPSVVTLHNFSSRAKNLPLNWVIISFLVLVGGSLTFWLQKR